VTRMSTIAHPACVGSLLLLLTIGPSAADDASQFAGRWDATVVVSGVEIPCAFEVATHGGTLQASFFNGDRRIASTGSQLADGIVTFSFDQYGAKLRVASKDRHLVGEYQRGSRSGAYAFRAVPAVSARPGAVNAPSIDGVWLIPTHTSKGESAWRFIVHQARDKVSATILRVDGDTGTLTGSYRDGRFVLSHFSGARPLLLEVTVQNDGTLALRQNQRTSLVAMRAETARARGVGDPSDPARHTSVLDPKEPFRFNYPDLQGQPVSNADPRFQGKVIVVSITGSWCPNCHDEAPFLAELYRKYRSRGLEVVALAFEEADQLSNPTRLRAFVKQFGLDYPVLVAGVPDEVRAKVPQATNLDAFPTTFFVGRDGLVRGVHAGFPSPGSGTFYTQAAREVTTEVERLLSEHAPARR
jgi:thiol-disulfide isomerase/thioredoxin